LVIDTDHSPFFSAPEQLFNLIVKSLWCKYEESYRLSLPEFL
jgi:hypothetical protein